MFSLVGIFTYIDLSKLSGLPPSFLGLVKFSYVHVTFHMLLKAFVDQASSW